MNHLAEDWKQLNKEAYKIILMISHSTFVGNWLDGLKTNVSQVQTVFLKLVLKVEYVMWESIFSD